MKYIIIVISWWLRVLIAQQWALYWSYWPSWPQGWQQFHTEPLLPFNRTHWPHSLLLPVPCSSGLQIGLRPLGPLWTRQLTHSTQRLPLPYTSSTVQPQETTTHIPTLRQANGAMPREPRKHSPAHCSIGMLQQFKESMIYSSVSYTLITL